jgi:HEAT repeat protein
VQYPVQYPGQPYGYNAGGQPVQPVSYANQAMDRTAAATPPAQQSATLSQLIQVLQESPYPAQREWAATNLSSFDYKVYPHLTQVLIQAANKDAMATVRAAAVYSLSRLNAQTEPVVTTLQNLRNDADPRVRQEVEQAFVRMGLPQQQQQQPAKQ